MLELKAALARLPTNVVVYDFETSGLSPEYDQAISLGAVRTDRNFSLPTAPTDELDLRARRHPWVVPSPTAMLVTRTSPEQLRCGTFHHYMMEKAEEFFRATSPTLFVGYNSVHFDERHLRGALFRSLCRPYLTQSNGSTRADLMVMMQAIAAIDPSAIRVPLSETGKRTFRLGPICRANGIVFAEDDAHDALNDVRATLVLARCLKRLAPDLFDQTLALADKRYVQGILRPAAPIIRLKTVAGVSSVRAFAVVEPVEDDANARICIDLTGDPSDYLRLDLDQLRVWARRKPSPMSIIRVNAHEMVFAADEPGPARRLRRLVRSRAAEQEIPSVELMSERAALIASDEDFIDRLQTLVTEQYAAFEPSPDPEAQLYSGGHPDDRDYDFAKALRNTFPWERGPMAAYFRDPRLREFSQRISYEEDPSSLDPATRARMDAWMRERLLGPIDAPWRTIAAARAEILKLSATVAPVDEPRLRAISKWLDALEADAQAAPAR